VEILHGSDEEEREGQAPLGRLESLHHTKRDLTEGFLEDPRKHLLGVNFIVKVNQHMDVSTLLNLLYEECVIEGASIRVDRDGYQMNVNLCEILHIYFSKLDQAID
jgi:hypothetical protein